MPCYSIRPQSSIAIALTTGVKADALYKPFAHNRVIADSQV
jgi:hypothetical protein